MAEAPCTWPLDTTCCSKWGTYTPETQAAATAYATQILWALTGRRFGNCGITIRPCGSACRHGGWEAFPVSWSGSGGGVLNPYNWNGQWFNCVCPGRCRCKASCEVDLPYQASDVTVYVDGLLLSPDAYRLDNQGFTLVRTDGECFPKCQDLDLSDVTDEGTFFVTYADTPVPAGGDIAAGMLACDFAKNCGSAGCGLPVNVSSITRQGVEVSMPDPTEVLNAGLTGISLVDLWIRANNPYRMASRPRVVTRDRPRLRTVVLP